MAALINIDPMSWLQSLDTILDNTTDTDAACVILDILDYTDEFIAYKDELLIKAHKEMNTLCSYIKELIIVLIQAKLATRPPLRPYYVTIDPQSFKANNKSTIK